LGLATGLFTDSIADPARCVQTTGLVLPVAAAALSAAPAATTAARSGTRRHARRGRIAAPDL
jgi:hypothetical protein